MKSEQKQQFQNQKEVEEYLEIKRLQWEDLRLANSNATTQFAAPIVGKYTANEMRGICKQTDEQRKIEALCVDNLRCLELMQNQCDNDGVNCVSNEITIAPRQAFNFTRQVLPPMVSSSDNRNSQSLEATEEMIKDLKNTAAVKAEAFLAASSTEAGMKKRQKTGKDKAVDKPQAAKDAATQEGIKQLGEVIGEAKPEKLPQISQNEHNRIINEDLSNNLLVSSSSSQPTQPVFHFQAQQMQAQQMEQITEQKEQISPQMEASDLPCLAKDKTLKQPDKPDRPNRSEGKSLTRKNTTQKASGVKKYDRLK